MRRAFGTLLVLASIAATSSKVSAQQGIYMLVDSIRGDLVAPHDREFKLSSFVSSAASASTVSTGTTSGLSSGKPTFPPVKVSMAFRALPSASFNRSVVLGTRMPSIEIRHYNSTNRMFYKTVYENVNFTNVTTEGADEAQQTIEFVYGRVKWFAPTDPARANAPVQIACWDVTMVARC
jgi:type VI protein secretion system component Hcp